MLIFVRTESDGIKGNTMSDIPTPEHAGVAKFMIEFWQHILAGTIVILTSWYVSSRGKRDGPVKIHITDRDLERVLNKKDVEYEMRLQLCKQSVVIALRDELDKRDEKLLAHIKDLLGE